jgi:hypothetical protein
VIYLAHPDAVLVAAATYVGLWVTKQQRALPTIDRQHPASQSWPILMTEAIGS